MNSNMYLNNIKRKSIKKSVYGTSDNAKLPLFIEFLLNLIDKILSVRVSPLVKSVIKISASVVCVICFVGVIGGIETGVLTFTKGILFGLVLTFAEILVLKD